MGFTQSTAIISTEAQTHFTNWPTHSSQLLPTGWLGVFLCSGPSFIGTVNNPDIENCTIQRFF